MTVKELLEHVEGEVSFHLWHNVPGKEKWTFDRHTWKHAVGLRPYRLYSLPELTPSFLLTYGKSWELSAKVEYAYPFCHHWGIRGPWLAIVASTEYTGI